ncbi:MAG: Gfo/Idh/MocA family oxidoreductase [Firmicutes bacterium]|nr:Gfo/Idh/MocA family oxidoreductase [Bacillota bacterium]
MEKVRVALIGCGRVASVHADALRALDTTELVACVDIRRERAENFSEMYTDGKAQVFTDYKEALALDNVDAVQICLPHHLHAPVTIDALNAGKHVLTEKPMAITVEDMDAMIEAAEKNNKTLGVIFQNRYNDSTVAVKEAIDSGKLGKIIGARAFVTWKRTDEYYSQSDWKGTWDKEGGGTLIDQAIHTIDLMHYLIGMPTEISASYFTRDHELIDVDDVAEALIRFDNGAKACLYANCYYVYDAPIYLEIVGEKGRAEIRADKADIYIGNTHTHVEPTIEPTTGKTYWGASHSRQIANYYESLLAGKTPDIDGRKGKVAAAMVLAMYESARSGETIKFSV